MAAAGEDRLAVLNEIAEEVAMCIHCRELAGTRKFTVPGAGNPEARVVFVGEAPGEKEDARGLPFVGAAGKLLTAIIEKGMGLKRAEVFICNALRCRPPGNRRPTDQEIANCRPYLARQLNIIRPEAICALGSVAVQALLWRSEPVARLRGQLLFWRGIPVVVTYHPSYLLRNESAKRFTWEDIQWLMEILKIEPPKRQPQRPI